MAARSPTFGIAHPTVVPTNFERTDDDSNGEKGRPGEER